MKIFTWIVVSMLTVLARLVLWRHKPTVVAVTGNVGKTTTKDVIHAVLSTQRQVRSNAKSLNSEVGIPLAIFGRTVANSEKNLIVWLGQLWAGVKEFSRFDFPEIVVLEVGAGAPGDITSKAKWLRSHISVFTALSAQPVHIEFFKDRDELFNEKKQLAVHTRDRGTLIYNSDDDFFEDLLSDLPHKKVSVGSVGDVSTDFGTNDLQGVQGRVQVRGVDHDVLIPGVWGATYLQSLGLAMGVAVELGLDVSECIDHFAENFKPNPGRMRVLQGINNSILIDDSYNASPLAVNALLREVAKQQVTGNKIFIFGDMKELGEASTQAHKDVGAQAARSVDVLVTVGDESRMAGQAAIDQGMDINSVLYFETSREAGEYVAGIIKKDDLVCAKSSRHAIKMERALEQIVAPQERNNLVQEYLI